MGTLQCHRVSEDSRPCASNHHTTCASQTRRLRHQNSMSPGQAPLLGAMSGRALSQHSFSFGFPPNPHSAEGPHGDALCAEYGLSLRRQRRVLALEASRVPPALHAPFSWTRTFILIRSANVLCSHLYLNVEKLT